MSGFESPIAAPIKQNEIKMLCCSKAFRARCFKGQGNAKGNTLTERTVLAGKDKLTSTTLLSDQRGAVAFEMPIVWLFLMMSLLLPLADLLSLASSLYPRGGHCVTSGNLSSTTRHLTSRTRQVGRQAKLATTADRWFPIKIFNVVCGDDSACSTTNTASPKYYSYTTTVTLSPMVLRSVLCTSSPARSHCLTQNGSQ